MAIKKKQSSWGGKREGAGRKRVNPPKPKPAEKGTWGGRREGAGRKAGVKIVENPRNTMLPFRVSELTAQRVKALRELTKQDEMPFVTMLENWVADLAKEYGIE